MQAIQVTLRNLKHSPALVRRIHSRCEALERFHPRIQHCRVSVEQEERHSAADRPFRVTLRVALPGHELVADHCHHVDPFLAVRDAFAAMRRQLKDAAAVTRGETKVHSRNVTESTP